MARIVTVVVESGKGGFSCFMSKDSDDLNFGIIGDGKTVQAAMDDFYVCRDEEKKFFEEEGREFPDLEFRFVLMSELSSITIHSVFLHLPNILE